MGIMNIPQAYEVEEVKEEAAGAPRSRFWLLPKQQG